MIINNNKITSIPKQIKNLNSLIKLDMWSNELNHIPDEIGLLTSLKEVDFRVIQFSDREKKRISALLPNAKIYFSNSCNCGD